MALSEALELYPKRLVRLLLAFVACEQAAKKPCACTYKALGGVLRGTDETALRMVVALAVKEGLVINQNAEKRGRGVCAAFVLTALGRAAAGLPPLAA